MWKIYDTLLENLPQSDSVSLLAAGEIWTLAQRESGDIGIAMTTRGETIAPEAGDLKGLTAQEAAAHVKSWNLMEASRAMAVINACYNTQVRMDFLQCYEPFENYCTQGLDFTGKTVGIVGHMNMPQELLCSARNVYILERNPKPGDYPDPACEYLLPMCDVVLITGSAFVNKTLPRLVDLCKNAYTIVTGPTVPMCPELLNLGIDRLAGLVITDPEGIFPHVTESRNGHPYGFGKPFLIKGDAK